MRREVSPECVPTIRSEPILAPRSALQPPQRSRGSSCSPEAHPRQHHSSTSASPPRKSQPSALDREQPLRDPGGRRPDLRPGGAHEQCPSTLLRTLRRLIALRGRRCACKGQREPNNRDRPIVARSRPLSVDPPGSQPARACARCLSQTKAAIADPAHAHPPDIQRS